MIINNTFSPANKIEAYAKLLRLPGIGALGIITVIGALTVGVTDIYNLSIIFIIGAIACIYGFILNDYSDVEIDELVDELHGKPFQNIPGNSWFLQEYIYTRNH